MNGAILKWTLGVMTLALFAVVALGTKTYFAYAFNIIHYKDTISDSGPEEYANHNLEFTLNTTLSPSSVLEMTPPPGFTVIDATSTFAARNVELLVNGTPRTADIVPAPGVDGVEIISGSPGLIRYTLAPNRGIASGAQVQLRVGNNTTQSHEFSSTYSTTTGTTTILADVEPIKNSNTLGNHEVKLEIYDGGLVAKEEFVIFLNEKVSIANVDTTETIPPYRFNPAPTSTVGGTTLYVEISLETDEFSICRYSSVAGVDYNAMVNTFDNTGLIFHSGVVPVVPASFNQFFIRCIDDEGNFNIDDFVIEFAVNDVPTGEANTEGGTSGDGTGTGESGTGSGSGGGGTTGEPDGEEPLEGGSAGSGGAGGGGGGGSGGSGGGTAGGGFESTDQVYPSGDGRVIISGYAYPNSTVTILVDGKFFRTARANASGVYSITLDQIARGVYTFGVYAAGPDGTKSSTFSTSFTVTGGRTSALTNVNVAPSILVKPDPVNPGETLTVSGYALPNAAVSIENGKLRSSLIKSLTVTSGSNGFWTTTIDTNGFSVGTYQIRAKSAQTGGATTNWSEYTYYGVGEAAESPLNADLNRDGKVNLVDFSILLYWWNTDGGTSDPPADINRDARVTLTDFSIMLFQWSG